MSATARLLEVTDALVARSRRTNEECVTVSDLRRIGKKDAAGRTGDNRAHEGGPCTGSVMEK